MYPCRTLRRMLLLPLMGRSRKTPLGLPTNAQTLVIQSLVARIPPHPSPPQALEGDLLDKESLGMVNAYQPSLTSTWMFQKSMSVGVGEKVDANLIVDLLANNFRSMDKVSFSGLQGLVVSTPLN